MEPTDAFGPLPDPSEDGIAAAEKEHAEVRAEIEAHAFAIQRAQEAMGRAQQELPALNMRLALLEGWLGLYHQLGPDPAPTVAGGDPAAPTATDERDRG